MVAGRWRPGMQLQNFRIYVCCAINLHSLASLYKGEDGFALQLHLPLICCCSLFPPFCSGL
jgi:hypothetical protein